MRTALQHAADRRRRDARRRAWADGQAFEVGRLDAWLYSPFNPYQRDSPNAHAWLDGYEAGSQDRERPFQFTTKEPV